MKNYISIQFVVYVKLINISLILGLRLISVDCVFICTGIGLGVIRIDLMSMLRSIVTVKPRVIDIRVIESTRETS